MGIDGIGKKGGPGAPVPTQAPSGADKARGAERPFEVHAPKDAAPIDKAHAVDPSSPLGQLRAGKIDVERYVDLKVEEATAHLQGLGPNDLAKIKAMVRTQAASDPALADLITQAAGHAPKIETE